VNSLISCPFCDSPDTEVIDSGDGYYTGTCMKCGAFGETAFGIENAIEKWNTHTKEQKLQILIDDLVKYIKDMLNAIGWLADIHNIQYPEPPDNIWGDDEKTMIAGTD